MRARFERCLVLPVVVLLLGGCGGGGARVIEAGTSGFGPGTGEEPVIDVRGRYLTSESQEQEDAECFDLTSTVDRLTDTQLPIEVRQDGDALYILVGDQSDSPNPFHVKVQLYGSVSANGGISARGTFSVSFSGTQNGISGTINGNGTITLSATLNGEVLSGSFTVKMTTNISGMGQSTSLPCDTTITFSATRADKPK